uniref:BTB domain-containing protein n=1 Tax=Panagrellus redivivus TaxID=6233 RepID=A0A7E4W2T4_PANRE
MFKATSTQSIYIDDNRSVSNSPMKDVEGIPGLQWSFHYYPQGRQKNGVSEFTIRICGGSAKIQATFESEEYDEKQNFLHVFNNGEEHGCPCDISPDGYNVSIYGHIKCTATFEPAVTKLRSPRPFELVDNSKPHCYNAEIVVGQNRLKVHRGFLSMISPVFHAAFTHKTKEAETGILEIKDFNIKTVRNAIDYLYGKEVKTQSAVEIVDILRFVDKYNIEPATAILEEWLNANLTIETFAGIATYAWQYDRKELQQKCGKLYRDSLKEIALHPDFVKLEPTIMAGVVSSAFAVTGTQGIDNSDFYDLFARGQR